MEIKKMDFEKYFLQENYNLNFTQPSKLMYKKAKLLLIVFFGLLFTSNIKANNVNSNEFSVYTSSHIKEWKMQSKIINSSKWGITYELFVGSDVRGVYQV